MGLGIGGAIAPVGSGNYLRSLGKVKRKRKKLGTLTVSVGGLRWWPHKAPNPRQKSWRRIAEWFELD